MTCTKVGCRTLAGREESKGWPPRLKQPQRGCRRGPPVVATQRRGWGLEKSCLGVRPNSIICTRSASRITPSFSCSSCASALHGTQNASNLKMKLSQANREVCTEEPSSEVFQSAPECAHSKANLSVSL